MAVWVSIVFMIIFLVSIFALFAVAQIDSSQNNISIHPQFNMDTIDDSNLSDVKLLVDLSIFTNNNKIEVIWKHVGIMPVHDQKKVCLTALQYSTLDGSITDVIVQDSHFSFTINFYIIFASDKRTVSIIGNKNPNTGKWEVKGLGLWWSDILGKTIKTEWISTDKEIILPYKKVL